MESRASGLWAGTTVPKTSSTVRTTPKVLLSDPGFNSYHNQSSIVLGEGKSSLWKEEEPAKSKKTGNEKPVWNYDPKNAGKTTMVLGSDKPDYRKKGEVYKERTPTTLTSSRKK